MIEDAPALGRKRPQRTSSERVAELLRGLIISGELPLGSPVRQQKVASRFGVSTTPVREAIQMLQAEGLLHIDPHRGAIVRNPSLEEVKETFDMRIALEGLAVEKAVPNTTNEMIVSLRELVDAMERTDDLVAWAELNQRFHDELYEAARQPRLATTIDQLRDSCLYYVNMVSQRNGKLQADQGHRLILKAIEARDAGRARAAVEVHLHDVREAVLDMVAFEEPSRV